jgi:hypothetical protein
MFSATERCGTRFTSWKMVAIPPRCAALGEVKLTSLPRS